MVCEDRIADWLPLIRGEFRESPGLILTKAQVRRLWGLDAETCDEVLDALVASSFLRKTERDMYALA